MHVVHNLDTNLTTFVFFLCDLTISHEIWSLGDSI